MMGIPAEILIALACGAFFIFVACVLVKALVRYVDARNEADWERYVEAALKRDREARK